MLIIAIYNEKSESPIYRITTPVDPKAPSNFKGSEESFQSIWKMEVSFAIIAVSLEKLNCCCIKCPAKGG